MKFAGRLASSMCRWLLLIAEFDATAGHERYGMPCTASWLGHWCGLSRRTAAEHVRVARVLAREAALADAMHGGRLSYSQVRAISRVAEPGAGELISMLISVAENGTVAHLESVIAGLRTVDDHDPTRSPSLPREYARSTFDDGSHWRLTARLAPEDGALIDAALATIIQSLPPEPTDTASPAGDSVDEPAGARPAQVRALIKLAELAMAALAHDNTNHDDTNHADTKRATSRQARDPENTVVVIHVDADQLPREPERGTSSSTPPCVRRPGVRRPGVRRPGGRIQRGPGLPDRVVHRLLCDGRIRTVLEWRGPDGRRHPLDLGRRHRVVSDKLFQALLIRDEGCRHPGCGSTRNLHAHHLRHWLYGGHTNLDNLVLLCARHHHEHHEGRLHIHQTSPGQFRMWHTDIPIPTGPAPGQAAETAPPLEDEHDHVPPAAARTRWTGERLDRPYAVAVAASIRRAGRRDAAPTREQHDAVA